jgi:hypothetical protein
MPKSRTRQQEYDSYFSKMSWNGDAIPTVNLVKISESEAIIAKN